MGRPWDQIIEISREMQGPFATLFVADLAAEVTKIRKSRNW